MNVGDKVKFETKQLIYRNYFIESDGIPEHLIRHGSSITKDGTGGSS